MGQPVILGAPETRRRVRAGMGAPETPTPRAAWWEVLGAWLHLWTPPRGVEVPPVPWRWVAAVAAGIVAVVAVLASPRRARDRRREARGRDRRRPARPRRAAGPGGVPAPRPARDRRPASAPGRSRRRFAPPSRPARAPACARASCARSGSSGCAATRPEPFTRGRLRYECLAVRVATRSYPPIRIGVPFVAVVSADRRSVAWCKVNLLAGEGAAFAQVTVPLPTAVALAALRVDGRRDAAPAAMTAAELRARRAAAQGLHPPVGGAPEAVVRAAPRRPGAGLPRRAARPAGARARRAAAPPPSTPRSTAERSLVDRLAHAGHAPPRRRARTTPWLLALTAPAQEAGARRRFGQLGVVARRRGPRRRVDRSGARRGRAAPARCAGASASPPRGLPTAGQATPHLLAAAVRRGVAVLGAGARRGAGLALTRDWLGPPPPAPDRSGRARRARPPLAGRARAGDRRRPRRLVRPAAARRPRRPAARSRGELARPRRRPRRPRRRARSRPAGRAPARLLPAFDPFLLGWRDRGFAVAAAHAARVHPGGGILRAVATAGGRVVGTWTARRRAAASPSRSSRSRRCRHARRARSPPTPATSPASRR